MLRDGDLVERILGGDPAAGERLVREHYPRIYRLLRHLTGSVETAQDLTQQTFVKAWQALERFRRDARLSPWLNRIAYHEYTHWLRALRPHTTLEEVAETPDPHAARQMAGIIDRGPLTLLPREQREAFLLFYVQRLSVEEIALILEIPPGTVKSRLFAARRRLRALLEAPTEVVRHDVPATQPTHECP
jgi:RNA polymerase sigma-70 factor (ECF subfamily)